jgi:hypothetical protein
VRDSAEPFAGGVRLTLPAGYRGRWLSDPSDRASVERWTSSSREHCLYNTPAYVEFARARNGRADLLWLVRDGNPVLGIPLHPSGSSRLTTGYSGMMFAAAPGVASLRRGMAALDALLGANPRLGFQVLQAAQAAAYDDHARMTALSCLIDRHALRGPALYSRVLEPDGAEHRCDGAPQLGSELLLEHGLGPYEAELRNQIRQAVRRGLHVTCSLPSSESELQLAYRDFVPLHRESWRRTGMAPHPPEYWLALARAVLDAGGRDVVVEARDGDGTVLAAVTCHVHGDRALYWAGASSEAGLRSRANPLCLHAAIQACAQLGVRHFELGRLDARESSPKELAITRYKAQFGGALVRVLGFQTEPRGWRALSVLRARARGAAARSRRRRPD